jgi:hypothetical protein
MLVLVMYYFLWLQIVTLVFDSQVDVVLAIILVATRVRRVVGGSVEDQFPAGARIPGRGLVAGFPFEPGFWESYSTRVRPQINKHRVPLGK